MLCLDGVVCKELLSSPNVPVPLRLPELSGASVTLGDALLSRVPSEERDCTVLRGFWGFALKPSRPTKPRFLRGALWDERFSRRQQRPALRFFLGPFC